jgi:FKBP-type peptidyl-prolyl cis-trans isomerase 2
MILLDRIPMNLRSFKGDTRAATSAAFIVLIAVLMVSASSVAILLYDSGQRAEAPEVQYVRSGDTVKVNYIGQLEDDRVFDTSLWEVASNDALYPKSLTFTLRNESQYTPLGFQVGTGQMIQGFDQGVIGMYVNQTKVLEIPPEEGYGPLNTSKLVEVPYIEMMDVFEVYTFDQFDEKFDVDPVSGMTLKDPQWKWDVTIMSVSLDADSIMVMNQPDLGAKYPVYGKSTGEANTGWYIKVDYYDSTVNDGKGEIRIRNLINVDQASYIKGVYDDGSQFILYDVDPESNTITLNFNGELVGQTLIFTVTLVEIVE